MPHELILTVVPATARLPRSIREARSNLMVARRLLITNSEQPVQGELPSRVSKTERPVLKAAESMLQHAECTPHIHR